MNPSRLKLPWQAAHFVGIGGAGMSGLALILQECGVTVTGSDTTDSVFLRRLRTRGIDARMGHDADGVGAADVLVYSSAVPADNPERLWAASRSIPQYRRGSFLALLAACFPCVISVAGSHGKTTTAAMLTHILKQCGMHPGYMIGGDVPAWPSPASAGGGRLLVTEVDESDGTQAEIRSTIGIVTNVEDDHCWGLGGIAGLERCFLDFARGADRLVAWRTPTSRRLFASHAAATFPHEQSIPPDLELAVPGHYNRVNAALAIEAAAALGCDRRTASRALESFGGVGRRMTEHYRAPDAAVRIIEDYAHHPTELAAALEALREGYPDHHLLALFQPHRFERVKRFASDFSRILSAADSVVVVQPFSAWVDDPDIADPGSIARGIRSVPAEYLTRPLPELAGAVADRLRNGHPPAVIAVIGAGDVYRVIEPLRNRLVQKTLSECADALTQACPELHVACRRPWSALTSLRIGSHRPLVAEPETDTQLHRILECASERNIPTMALGNGSNIVGSDRAEPVLVVRLHRGDFGRWTRHARHRVTAGSGVAVPALFGALVEHAELPLKAAPLAWIPGTIGGAVRMNAGAHGAEIGDFVAKVTGRRRDGTLWEKCGSEIAWNYRATDIPADVTITTVDFTFHGGGNRKVRDEYRRCGLRRRQTQPSGNHAGCIFRNAGEAPAGRLLDQYGCKGYRNATCRVSRKHANFFICDKGASEDDFLGVLMRARRTVYSLSGVRLIPEVVFANPASAQRIAADLPALNIAVLKGGPSTERSVSLKSGAAVAHALRQAGHAVTELDVTAAELPPIPAATDVVFPALHGAFGEDGQVQRLLDARGIPYVGSGADASRLIISKRLSKDRLIAAGIPTPAYTVVSAPDAPLPEALRFPLVVKPDTQGSTVGMTRLKAPSGWWTRALRTALAFDTTAVVEEYVTGTEATIAVLDGEALPMVEIVPPNGRMFDFDAKYDHKRGHTQYHCPPRSIDADVQRVARDIALKVYVLLGAKDILRVDFIIDGNGTPWVLEANSIPGFTGTSLFPMAARAAGIGFPELCARLVIGNAH